MMSISAAVSSIIDPKSGQPATLSETNKKFMKEHQEGVRNLDSSSIFLTFMNVISKEGSCGFANAGSNDYLLNTDTGGRYRVTVRTFWTQGINNGQFDYTHEIEAGGKKYLGCTDSGAIPVAYYTRQVVGEVKS